MKEKHEKNYRAGGGIKIQYLPDANNQWVKFIKQSMY